MGRFHAVYDKLNQALDEMLGISVKVKAVFFSFFFNYSTSFGVFILYTFLASIYILKFLVRKL